MGVAVQDELYEQEDKRTFRFPLASFYSRSFVNLFGSISLLQSSMETIKFDWLVIMFSYIKVAIFSF